MVLFWCLIFKGCCSLSQALRPVTYMQLKFARERPGNMCRSTSISHNIEKLCCIIYCFWVMETSLASVLVNLCPGLVSTVMCFTLKTFCLPSGVVILYALCLLISRLFLLYTPIQSQTGWKLSYFAAENSYAELDVISFSELRSF